jgi:hypothetical protein
MDWCTPTQNPKPLKDSDILLQAIVYECNDTLVSYTRVKPRYYMLDSNAEFFLKSLYFWLLKNRDVTNRL